MLASKVICLLLGSAALFVGALPVDGHAQASPSAVPDNARKRSYGWECNRGFRETGGNCVAVIVPANAYLSPEGTSWTCNRGFRPEGAACKAVQVPVNAYVVDTSTIEAGMQSRLSRRRPELRAALGSRARLRGRIELWPRLGMRARLSRVAGCVRRDRSSGRWVSGVAATTGSANEVSAASASAATRSPFP